MPKGHKVSQPQNQSTFWNVWKTETNGPHTLEKIDATKLDGKKFIFVFDRPR
jgi:hypothetical protein